MTDTSTAASLSRIETRAQEILSLLQFANRAFVIEFAGTPKSGKSTAVEAIRHFFTRQGFRVHVLAERAAVCPIPMKGHLFFNTWCAASMLAELLANVETETDIIIVDRGLFDSLVWLTLQTNRGELSATEARTFEDFLLLERWRSLIDLAIVMSVDADEALRRESAQRLTAKGGSIMNRDVLSAFTASVDQAFSTYEARFRAVVRQDNTGQDPKASGAALANHILDALNSFLNPDILVVPRAPLEEAIGHTASAFGPQRISFILEFIRSHATFMPRALAESSADHVQIIPCGVLCHKDEVFLFQRKEKDPKSSLFGVSTLWQGCHVARDDQTTVPDLLTKALMDRLSRSLFLSLRFPVEAMGYCWNRADERSKRHFGVPFRIKIDNDWAATDFRKKEFRKKRGYGLSGGFYKWDELRDRAAKGEDLEPWSQAIIENMESFR